jgi:hypothetical protein
MAVQMETRIFRRVVEEQKEKVRRAAVRAIADTMQETYRFGFAGRDFAIDRAKGRLRAAESGKPWSIRRPR